MIERSTFSPGTLVRARGREWIVLPGSTADILDLRPVSGSEEDRTRICTALETEPVTSASFPPPAVHQKSDQSAALLLRDALLLSLRRGAGPFRSFGQIAVRPRGYQLVPLMMALKQDTIRLLIADDVGIGKTIEAGLVARELLDRGEITRMAVLCPPHLVDQWVEELEGHFHIRAVPVTAANASRLERGLPPSESVFTVHPHTVVSLDYIKSQNRRDKFLASCPEFVIVDEAHACAATGQGVSHLRYDLLRGLADDPKRHLVLLTATPHSGDEDAFFRLLALLHPDFRALASAEGHERAHLRERLAKHFVQRRRPDIEAWRLARSGDDDTHFPDRETSEFTYALSGPWAAFLESVLAYCREVVRSAEGDERRQRLNFWGTLALMRCVASSPAAAHKALRSRAGFDDEADPEGTAEADEVYETRLMDGSADALPDDDQEPGTQPAGDVPEPALVALIDRAAALKDTPGEDPKLEQLTRIVKQLQRDGFDPVVFCRYIATAEYVAEHLRAQLRDTAVAAVTGELTSDERKAQVAALGSADRRVLVATDCLSEGINLQSLFDAVVHYDLSWNPTRHEQREGRVDRFGQPSKTVRTSLIYGRNNPVDGAVLDVILRKAQKIRQELGVPVPLPTAGTALTQALLKAVMLSSSYGMSQAPEQLNLFSVWESAAEKAKRNRSIFAQERLKPEDVLPEYTRSLAAVGGTAEVRRFTERALARLGSGLEVWRKAYKAPLSELPTDVRERLEAEGLSGTVTLDFKYPAESRALPVLRSHPLVAVLAETLLERTLSVTALSTDADAALDAGPGVLGRAGVWYSTGVTARTTLVLLRLRHQLQRHRAQRTTTSFVEEATALGWVGTAATPLDADAALAALTADATAGAGGELPEHVRTRTLGAALQLLDAKRPMLEAFAHARAQALLADHERVRDAAGARGGTTVTALLPVDVVGLYVLLPRVQDDAGPAAGETA
jgi:superfamily II DNA or RNA helicase